MTKTNQEILDDAVTFTNQLHQQVKLEKNPNIDKETLSREAIGYSAYCLMLTMECEHQPLACYTRTNNLRYDMASLGKDAIKSELLKNIIKLSLYGQGENTYFSKYIDDSIDPRATNEANATIIFNRINKEGIQEGFEMLNDPNTLQIACELYSRYRQPQYRQILDKVGQEHPLGRYLINEADTYYAKWGDRQSTYDGGFGQR